MSFLLPMPARKSEVLTTKLLAEGDQMRNVHPELDAYHSAIQTKFANLLDQR